MKIAITGATGLIGSSLSSLLESKGHKILKLSRSKNKEFVYWNYKSAEIDLERLEGVDVVVHLSGESIAGYWTKEKKREIETSRVEGTKFLVNSILKLQNKPKHFLCASAVGAYGDRADEIMDENSSYGQGFLADVARKWEHEAGLLESHGIRVVNLRIGLVLSVNGGAFKPMLLPFKIGLGGKLGSGKQYMSWVMLEDVVGSTEFIINNKNINGAVNIVSPVPVTNKQFTEKLGKALCRPTFFTVPSFVLNTLVPDMAKEMILCSTRAIPKKLLDSGYDFYYSDIDSSFADLLN
ncbi:MAG: TIGR01777 family protein [Candidatus Dadabacteria bacterium]|nr:TIGR01777 family protein [Candidatus Dadabacteria bacterium]NIY22890.1 TIGR01777 family protein [Candidatus Dadabacteria bacterium]